MVIYMKKRIAVMVTSLNFGGVERAMAELSVYLDRQGYDVHIFLLDDRDIFFPYGGEVHRISLFFKKYSLLNTIFTFQHFILTYYLKKKLKIDVTISALEFMNFINIMTARGDVIIPSLHNYRFQSEITPTLKDKFIERVFSRKVSKAQTIVTVADAIREKALSRYDLPGERIVTVYNTSDIDNINKLMRCPLDKKTEDFITPNTFVNISRLVKQKALDKLIAAFAGVAEVHTDARLIIIGDGNLRGELEKYAQSLGLSDKIMFTGQLKNPFNIVTKCRAFVLSSEYEGFGKVLVEAMCCGTPVISTDCMCGPREIIAPVTHGTAIGATLCEYGILTAPMDAAALTEAMKLVIEDDEVYKKYKSQSLIRARDFTPDIIYPKWIDVIEGVKCG